MNIFKNGSTIYFLEKNETDNMDVFLDRGIFIASQKCEDNLDSVVLYSNMYINNKYLGCEYDEVNMKIINEMVKKCYVS